MGHIYLTHHGMVQRARGKVLIKELKLITVGSMKARSLFAKVSNAKGHALDIAHALLLALKLMMSASKDRPHEAEVLTQLGHVHLRDFRSSRRCP